MARGNKKFLIRCELELEAPTAQSAAMLAAHSIREGKANLFDVYSTTTGDPIFEDQFEVKPNG